MTGHGGNLRALAQQAGRPCEEILDFSASINPLGPPPCLRAVLSRHIESLVHYPDPDSRELVSAIAKCYALPEGQIVVGNGSTELLYALTRAAALTRAVIPAPSYSDYAMAARRAGMEVHTLPLRESDGFEMDWRELDKALAAQCGKGILPVRGMGVPPMSPTGVSPVSSPFPAVSSSEMHPQQQEQEQKQQDRAGTSLEHMARMAMPRRMVLLGQPNNPTGLMLDPARLREFAAGHLETLFVVDEAFADFVADYPTLMRDLPPNVVVLRSMTKFFAIPGLRLGFAVASPNMAARMREHLLPWSVNAMAQAAGAAVLADRDYADRSRRFVREQRESLAAGLGAIPGLFVYPGCANFLLVRLNRSDIDAPALAARLIRRGIAIRVCDNYPGLDGRFFRVAVRTPQENARLLEELSIAAGSPRPPAKPRRTPAIMFQGTSSNAGKSVLTAALCRILLQDGVRVAPFKSQNMSLNSFVTADGGEMGRAQVVQAQACRLDPDVRMNPILLKPSSDTGSQVIVRGQPVGNMRVMEYVRYKPRAFAAAKECYDSLAADFDAIVIEGAGSPGEVNLKSHDIVNMRMALYAGSPVLVVGDIDRGGVFASFVGTMEVLEPWERALVAGWVVNRFRGDASLLGDALDYTLGHTGRPVLGVVPYLPALNLPQEDSVEFKSGVIDDTRDGERCVEIAVIDLPHISNFTDFDALAGEGDARVRIVRKLQDLGNPDAVILPGSKNTLADLAYLKRTGLAAKILEMAAADSAEIVGVCGGFQMLGRCVLDPQCVESVTGRDEGLGLLAVETVLAAEKTLVRSRAKHAPSGLEVFGYEIHHGLTNGCGTGILPVCGMGVSPVSSPFPAVSSSEIHPQQQQQERQQQDRAGTALEHMGKMPMPLFVREDGQSVGLGAASGRVWGTYLHGVFDADEFRRWFIDRLRVRRGLAPLGKVSARYDIEPALDRLADVVRKSLNMKEIHRLMGL
jgi:cobyric acid synthase CobQ